MDSKKFSKKENELLEYLENPTPQNFEKAGRLYGELAIGFRPSLINHVKNQYPSYTMPKDMVDEAIEKGFKHLVNVFNGHQENHGLKFERKYNLSLKGYLIRIIGVRTNIGDNFFFMGLIGNSKKKKCNQQEYTRVDDEQLKSTDNSLEYDLDIEEGNTSVLNAVKKLPPREQFVITSGYGLNEHLGFIGENLKERIYLCKFPPQESIKILSREEQTNISPNAIKLSQGQVATLLALSERQIRRIKTSALEKTTKYLQDNK